MSDLVTMLNHLAAAWLAEQTPGVGGLELRQIELDGQGGRLALRVDWEGFRGELLLRLHVEPAQGTRHTLRFEIERWPERMPAGLEPLRRVIETARIRVELDFGA